MKNKMRQWLSVVLCGCLAAGLSACGGTGGNPATGGKGEKPIELTYSGLDLGSGSVKLEDTEIVNYLEKKLNIKLTFVQYTSDQWAAGMASGDLPDIFQTRMDGTAVRIEEAIDAGIILELSDLVEKYGENIQKNIPEVLEYMKTYRSNGTGELYGISTNVPVNNPEGTDVVSDYGVGFLVRWDYYKEMGYPEINNEDEFLNMLKEMQETHPTTEDGKPVYAFGGFTDWGLWPYCVPYAFQHGWMNGTGYLVGPDAEIQPMFGEESEIFKKTLEFLNKANQMGLCDPEMFTMKNADYIGKHANLQYLTVPCNWWDTEAIEVQIEQGVAESDTGWRMIPGAFPSIYGGYPSRFGATERVTVISKSCKNPEAAMKLLNYLCSFEGSRLLANGIEGSQWEETNGQKEYTDEVLQEKMNNPTDFMNQTGIGAFDNMKGLAGNSIDENGQYLDLGKTDKAIEASLDAADIAFSEHYGVEYPAQAYEAKAKVVYYNYEPINMMDPLDSDMEMISTQCDNYYMTFVAELVNASNEEEFDKIWENGCAELQAMGYNELIDAIQNNVQAAKEELAGLGIE